MRTVYSSSCSATRHNMENGMTLGASRPHLAIMSIRYMVESAPSIISCNKTVFFVLLLRPVLEVLRWNGKVLVTILPRGREREQRPSDTTLRVESRGVCCSSRLLIVGYQQRKKKVGNNHGWRQGNRLLTDFYSLLFCYYSRKGL